MKENKPADTQETSKEIRSLEELIDRYVYWYNEYVVDEWEYPDERKYDWSSFLYMEKLLLKHFNLPNRKPYKQNLREVIIDYHFHISGSRLYDNKNDIAPTELVKKLIDKLNNLQASRVKELVEKKNAKK